MSMLVQPRHERKRSKERAQEEGGAVDGRAVTTYSIGHTYLADECSAEGREAGEGTAGGGTTLARPIIVGVDRKTGGVQAHQVKRPLGCDKNLQQTLKSWDTEDQS